MHNVFRLELGLAALPNGLVVVPREENDWVPLPHNETPTAGKMRDRPEKLCSLLSHGLALLFSLFLSLSITCQLWPQHGFNATAESIGLNLAIIAE